MKTKEIIIEEKILKLSENCHAMNTKTVEIAILGILVEQREEFRKMVEGRRCKCCLEGLENPPCEKNKDLDAILKELE